jgi:hypothetical protein
MQRRAANSDESDPNAVPADGSQNSGLVNGQNQSTDPAQAGNQNPNQNQTPGVAGQPANGGDGTNANSGQGNGSPNNGTGTGTASGIANQILRTPGPTTTPGQNGQTQNNPFSGGSIGGVASKVKGHSIKVVNDQRDYAKWEFVYDYRKDTGGSAANGQQAGAQIPTGTTQGNAFGGISNSSSSASTNNTTNAGSANTGSTQTTPSNQ